MAKEMSLEDIQKESISILYRIDSFFSKNNIDYSIGYGSLIGAIRHKGFIPWDDDVDIIITRPNYKKLLSLSNALSDETGLTLYAPEIGNCFVRVCRITDNTRTVVEKFYQWTDDETGLWIDMFVIDGILSIDSFLEFRNLFRRNYMACKSKLKIYYRETMIDNIKRIYHFIKDYKWWFVDRKKQIKETLNEFRIDYESCDLAGCYDSPYGDKDIFEKDVFSSYIRVPFENITVSVIAKYDIYLSSLYGDYLTPPSAEKQKRSHIKNHYYYKK